MIDQIFSPQSPAHFVEELTGEVSQLLGSLNNSADRLGQLHERLFGPMPPDGDEDAKVGAAGDIELLKQRVKACVRCVSRIEAIVGNLERL